jgi:hypothetical protein
MPITLDLVVSSLVFGLSSLVFPHKAVQLTELLPLLDHLAATNPASDIWRNWQIRRVGGGANNLLHRATGAGHDLAIKWTIRDERDRAGREHAALTALRQAGLDIAPAPILLERERYPQPVVVQT